MCKDATREFCKGGGDNFYSGVIINNVGNEISVVKSCQFIYFLAQNIEYLIFYFIIYLQGACGVFLIYFKSK